MNYSLMQGETLFVTLSNRIFLNHLCWWWNQKALKVLRSTLNSKFLVNSNLHYEMRHTVRFIFYNNLKHSFLENEIHTSAYKTNYWILTFIYVRGSNTSYLWGSYLVIPHDYIVLRICYWPTKNWRNSLIILFSANLHAW